MRIAVIDADVPAHQAAVVVQHNIDWGDGVLSSDAHPEEGERAFRDSISRIQEEVKADKVLLAFSDDDNFRLSVLPSYKTNRSDKLSPILKKHLKAYGTANYEAITKPSLEGDDVIGILLTRRQVPGDELIGCSIDKDMKTIPGKHFNITSGTHFKINQAQADYWHLMQALMGDPVDGYTGIPGVGPKTAHKILAPFITYHSNEDRAIGFNVAAAWDAVVAAYESKGLTEEDALVQARVARILRAEDYDFKLKKVKLWEAPKLK